MVFILGRPRPKVTIIEGGTMLQQIWSYVFAINIVINRGSFRTGSTGSWEPVNFEESYAEVANFDKTISKYLTFP